MKRIFLIVVFFLVVVSANCQNNTLRVTPQWLPQAQFAGLYIADSLGFYEELGLDVEIIHPSATYNSQQMLEDGATDIIITHLIDALIRRDKGFEMVNVLQCSEKNSMMLVSHKPVKSIDEFKEKKIGHWKAGFSYLGFILDKRNNLQVEWIPFHSNIALYISGAIDATLAMEYNEYF